MKSFKQFIAEETPVQLVRLSSEQFPLLMKATTGNRNRTLEAITKFIAIANEAISDAILTTKDKNKLIDLYRSITGYAGEYLASKHSSRLPGEETQDNWQQHHQYGIIYRDATQKTGHYPQSLDFTVDHLKAQQLAHPLKDQFVELAHEYRILADTIKTLDETLNEKKVKKERERREREAAIPHATRNAQEMVRRVLMAMTNAVKVQYVQQVEEPWVEQLKEFFDKEHLDQLSHLKLDPDSTAALEQRNKDRRAQHKENYGRSYGFQEETRPVSFLEQYLLPVAAEHDHLGNEHGVMYGNHLYGKPIWTPYPDWKHRIHVKAVQQGEDMQAHFVEKNVGKLASIIETKGNIDGDPKVLDVHSHQGIIQGNIKVSFQDGSKFVVRNKIVTKYYMGRTGPDVMYQFPTTFHDAVLPDGKRMAGQPSEAEMNKIFAVAQKS
jgi:hypothetical protein